ncbi:MAG: tetratricopeptide repeat protein, partial [Syntrophobacteraceae bacterium]
DGAIKLLRQTIGAAGSEGIELDRDSNVDERNLPVETRIASLLLRLGYREKAKELLTKSVIADEQDENSRSLLQTILREDNLDEIQRNKKDFTQKYVYHPFSSFNAGMAAAFLSRKMQLPSPLVKIGERLLDYALELKPDSADAHLLKGWYYYERNDFTAAVDEARRALDLEPDHYRAWLGLGIFLIGANQTYEAVAAFQKTLELYPGCPERSRINGLIAGLQEAHKSMATNENVRMN